MPRVLHWLSRMFPPSSPFSPTFPFPSYYLHKGKTVLRVGKPGGEIVWKSRFWINQFYQNSALLKTNFNSMFENFKSHFWRVMNEYE